MEEHKYDATDAEADAEAGLVWTTAQDWQPSAAEDPGNPRNWPLPKKLYHQMIPICIAFLW